MGRHNTTAIVVGLSSLAAMAASGAFIMVSCVWESYAEGGISLPAAIGLTVGIPATITFLASAIWRSGHD